MSPGKFLRKLRRYPAAEWPWMAEAALMLVWARLLIRFLPYRRLRRWMGPMGGDGPAPPVTPEQRRKATLARRWIERVTAHAPFPRFCLAQAMAARWMLDRRGVPNILHLGARPSSEENMPIDLHAWLVCGDLCVTGVRERDSFEAFGRRPSAAG